MKYLGITQRTANWLLSQANLLNSVFKIVISQEMHKKLQAADISAGPFNISYSSDSSLLMIWNSDYLSGVADDSVGFLRIDSTFGISSIDNIAKDAFITALYIINQRLQGLILDTFYIHRAYSNGASTCVAGRGSEAKQFSLGYFLRDVEVPTGGRVKSIVCVGPSRNWDALANEAKAESDYLVNLIESSTEIVYNKKPRPILDEVALLGIANLFHVSPRAKCSKITLTTSSDVVDLAGVYKTITWSYSDWMDSYSTLSQSQRAILESNAPAHYPMRIVGPAGSGKSLIMQLLAMRHLEVANRSGSKLRVLYLTHNSAMQRLIIDRFVTLGASKFLSEKEYSQYLLVSTLADYGRNQLQITAESVIDVDAQQTKMFQLEQIKIALREVLESNPEMVQQSKILSQIITDESLFDVFSKLVVVEISSGIKGHGLVDDENTYVWSEKILSRLHGVLNPDERKLIFESFVKYHSNVFEQFEVLDSDDIALSLFGRLKTPIWNLKRKAEGFDYIFIDEAQLFNENERRLFSFMSNSKFQHVPVVLALDEAQDLYNISSAGLGSLGIENIMHEKLPSIHRSSRSIAELAFFVIQNTTDLFNKEFPSFNSYAVIESSTQDDKPKLIQCEGEVKSFEKFILRNVQSLRRRHRRSIALIVHSDYYWDSIVKELSSTNWPIHILLQRGEQIDQKNAVIIITKPEFSGGQEFDSVISVGLEDGLVPPRIKDNLMLAAAIEQQSLREMYLAFTRARHDLLIIINKYTKPSEIIIEAFKQGLLEKAS